MVAVIVDGMNLPMPVAFDESRRLSALRSLARQGVKSCTGFQGPTALSRTSSLGPLPKALRSRMAALPLSRLIAAPAGVTIDPAYDLLGRFLRQMPRRNPWP